MSLSKSDLQKIEDLINKSLYTSFKSILIPYVDASIQELKNELKAEIAELRRDISEIRAELNDLKIEFHEFKEHTTSRFEKVEEEMRKLRGDMNEGFSLVHSRIDDAIALNKQYYQTSKKEHDSLAFRVAELESAR